MQISLKSITKYPWHLVLQYLFWMLFFALCRLIFLIYNFNAIAEYGFGEFIQCFVSALYLDHATACYIFGISVLLYFFQQIFQIEILHKVVLSINVLLIVVAAVIFSSELGLYDEWGVKINYKALKYLENPSEVTKTATTENYIYGIGTFLFLSIFGIWMYVKVCYKTFTFEKKRLWFLAPVYLFFGALIVVPGLRGGFQQIPIIQSDVYFSKHDIMNDAAVNSAWNLMQSVDQNFRYMGTNPYRRFNSPNEALSFKNKLLYVKKDSTISLLKTSTPNVVFILLESWSADLVFSIDSFYKGVTPNYDSLANRGVLFTNCISSGYRSEQGMAAVYSGYPAQPVTSIFRVPDKFNNLYCINDEFQKAGYYSSYFFGGQLSYGNIKAFLNHNKFDEIHDIDDLETDSDIGKLGIHDSAMFSIFKDSLDGQKEPFFANLFTLSSHSPFDHPKRSSVKISTDIDPYANSMNYTDECLGAFFKNIKSSSWYENTLFVVMADHSHHSPKRWGRNTYEYKKMPIMFFGEVIIDSLKGYRHAGIMSQTDITKTLMTQLSMNTDNLKWSKDVFNPYSKEFAFHTFEDGFGLVTNDGIYEYDYTLKDTLRQEFKHDSIKADFIKQGEAFLQLLFEDYLDR